ncbi:Uncharacterised protein [Escherichia coli]|uniref:Uncharacterized protein n=1 Tax=Escherichia coli TaxID=562 RepID=A0A3S4NQY6_ECOLX|nr:Uncharacterised protein [Escherichia coli]
MTSFFSNAIDRTTLKKNVFPEPLLTNDKSEACPAISNPFNILMEGGYLIHAANLDMLNTYSWRYFPT